MVFRQLMQTTAFGIGLEVTMGGSAYFDLHYGITGINSEVSNVEELAKSADKTHVCSLVSFLECIIEILLVCIESDDETDAVWSCCENYSSVYFCEK